MPKVLTFQSSVQGDQVHFHCLLSHTFLAQCVVTWLPKEHLVHTWFVAHAPFSALKHGISQFEKCPQHTLQDVERVYFSRFQKTVFALVQETHRHKNVDVDVNGNL